MNDENLGVTVEKHGIHPYRVFETDRITYFASYDVAINYYETRDEPKVLQRMIDGGWAHVSGNETAVRDYFLKRKVKKDGEGERTY